MSVWWRVGRRGLLPALAGSCVVLGIAAADAAPAGDVQNLEARISAAQTLESTLEQQIDDISARSGDVKVAQLFGESDEDKAARLQHEQAQDSSIATLNQRVGDVEESLRRLTGQVEQEDHRMSELGERMTRMQKDFDYKLCALAAQQLGAPNDAGTEDALPCNGTGQQTGMAAPSGGGPQNASREPIHLAPPPGVLGTLSRNDVANPPAPNQAPSNEMASIDARTQFDSAMNLLTRAQYEEARAAFQGFADSYPQESDLAARALYWAGAIAYSIQKDYAGAARAFAEELKNYPDNPHAPESMLKLGQSLIAMNQKKEGCTALGTLASRYPAASKSITDQTLDARKTARCR
jgi:tol-pal system protein YbgF